MTISFGPQQPFVRPVAGGLARARAAAACLAIAIALTGCKGTRLADVTGSITTTDNAMPTNDADLRAWSENWGKKFEANPADKAAAINFARGLRALARNDQAVAVMRQAAIKAPEDLEIIGAYGKALADAGQFSEAAQILQRAHKPERPNWSILSAQGAVADQMGDHTAAQAYYSAALKIMPGDPAVMSNLGLSQALSKRLPQAEETLRAAADSPAADARVRQNLALVLALQGKFAEAEKVSARDLSPADATRNIASIKRMIAQSNTWRDLQSLDGASARASAKSTPANQRAPAKVAKVEAPVADDEAVEQPTN